MGVMNGSSIQTQACRCVASSIYSYSYSVQSLRIIWIHVTAFYLVGVDHGLLIKINTKTA